MSTFLHHTSTCVYSAVPILVLQCAKPSILNSLLKCSETVLYISLAVQLHAMNIHKMSHNYWHTCALPGTVVGLIHESMVSTQCFIVNCGAYSIAAAIRAGEPCAVAGLLNEF